MEITPREEHAFRLAIATLQNMLELNEAYPDDVAGPILLGIAHDLERAASRRGADS